jgi:hypothetical protein
MILAIAAAVVASLTVVLARLIPDRYDQSKPQPLRVEAD